MRASLLLVISISMFGCAMKPVMVDIPDIEASAPLTVEDLRPESEKQNKIFSLAITSDAYATYRRGDGLVSPDPVRLFQHRVYEKYSEQQVPVDIKVHHLVVYMNLQSELRRNVTGGAIGGVVGSVIASGTQKYGVEGSAALTTQQEFEAFDAEYKRALYTEQENPGRVSIYRVYLDAEIDGKRTFVTTMTPARLPKEDGRNPHVAAVETAMAYFLDQY